MADWHQTEAVVVSEDAEPGLAEAIALLSKGVTLGRLGRSEEALVVFDDVIARYADAPEPVVREQVAHARVNRGVTLRRLGCWRARWRRRAGGGARRL